MVIQDFVAEGLTTPEQALANVTSKTGKGIYASADVLFNGSVFGRDSLVVAEDLLEIKPELVEQILIILAGFQGVKTEMFSEEEPGKIMHQYSTNLIDGVPREGATKLLYEEISRKWGGDSKEMIYYGSIDSTPLFIRVLCRYCHLHNHKLLRKRVQRTDGSVVTMKKALEEAINWLIKKLQVSKSGLLGYRALNPWGIQNQAWKDSVEFYIHENGQGVDHKQDVVSVEVQGLVYDSLQLAAEFLPKKSKQLRKLAFQVQRRVLNDLWLEDEEYFALGLDCDPGGKPRLVKTITANAAALLDSTIFDSLNENERSRYTCGIVRHIFSQDFLTDAGVRSRALRHQDLVPFWDYHGSFVTWPKETFAIARGLHRQYLDELAVELENRIVNVANQGGSYFEFVYVDGKGRVLLGPESTKKGKDVITIHSTNRPERMQAWTISAIMGIAQRRMYKGDALREVIPGWANNLKGEILRSINRIGVVNKKDELDKLYPYYEYRIEKRNPLASEYFIDKLHEQIRQNASK